MDAAQKLTGHDETRRDLASTVVDRWLRTVHVKAPHVPELLQEAHAHKTLRRERAHRSVVACRRNDDRGGDDIRVHARLRVVVERDERPVRDDARDALAALEVLAHDEVLDGRRIHHHHVRQREHLGQDRRREQRGVLDDDERALVLEGHAELREEAVCGLADDLRGRWKDG